MKYKIRWNDYLLVKFIKAGIGICQIFKRWICECFDELIKEGERISKEDSKENKKQFKNLL